MNKIRKFDEKMTDDVLRIWLDVNREAHDFIPCSYWEKSIRNMKKELSDLNIYVYEANGVVKGFVKMTKDNHILGVYVDRPYRREGIGSKLLMKCKEEREKLTLEVYLKNENALEFYKKHGFRHYRHQVDLGTIEREFVMKWSNRN
ncbi:MAG: GNAT family N-acetyltransferase [Clostridia bacterium]|jgi:putative acetyltransferase|nr:GNAT family N-acetyltransferase [Clostridia bacterium]